ncbi:MAG: TlpA disulfide reductase family protein [Aquihabitans sp.]
MNHRPRRTLRLLPLVLIALVGLSTLAACGGDSGAAVDYEAAEMDTGDPVSVTSLRGDPVLLVSWATWCRQCDEELARLQDFATSDDADGVTIVAVNLDAASVDDEIAAKIEQHQLTVPQWRDRRNDFKRTFKAIGVPTTVLIDADGMVAGTFPGALDFDNEEFVASLDEVRTK